MQIPYDLEFVENRPVINVQARAIALPQTYAPWHGKTRKSQDAFDALLSWVHRVISRHESKSR